MKPPLSTQELQQMFARIRQLKPDWQRCGVSRLWARTANGFHIEVEVYTGNAYPSGESTTYTFRVSADSVVVCDEHYKRYKPGFASDAEWLRAAESGRPTESYVPDEQRYQLLESFMAECIGEAERLRKVRLEAENRQREGTKQRFFEG